MDTAIADAQLTNPFGAIFSSRSNNVKSLLKVLDALISSLRQAIGKLEPIPSCKEFTDFLSVTTSSIILLKQELAHDSDYQLTRLGDLLNCVRNPHCFNFNNNSTFWSNMNYLRSEMNPEKFTSYFGEVESCARDYSRFLNEVMTPWLGGCLGDKRQKKLDNRKILQLINIFSLFECKTTRLAEALSKAGKSEKKIADLEHKWNEEYARLPDYGNLVHRLQNYRQYFGGFSSQKLPVYVSTYREINRNLMLVEIGLKSIITTSQRIIKEKSEIFKPEYVKSISQDIPNAYEAAKNLRQTVKSFWNAYTSNDQAAMASLLAGIQYPSLGTMNVGWVCLGLGTGMVAYSGVSNLTHSAPLNSEKYDQERPILIWDPKKPNLEHYSDYAGRLIKIMKRGYSPSPRRDFSLFHIWIDHIFAYDHPHELYGGHMALIYWPCDDYCVFRNTTTEEVVLVTNRPIPPNKLTIIIKDPNLVPFMKQAGIPYVDQTQQDDKKLYSSMYTTNRVNLAKYFRARDRNLK